MGTADVTLRKVYLALRRISIACHAAALSWILKRKLTFDPVKQEFIGDEEANGLRSRPARNWA
jgi:hypothetical protein